MFNLYEWIIDSSPYRKVDFMAEIFFKAKEKKAVGICRTASWAFSPQHTFKVLGCRRTPNRKQLFESYGNKSTARTLMYSPRWFHSTRDEDDMSRAHVFDLKGSSEPYFDFSSAE